MYTKTHHDTTEVAGKATSLNTTLCYGILFLLFGTNWLKQELQTTMLSASFIHVNLLPCAAGQGAHLPDGHRYRGVNRSDD